MKRFSTRIPTLEELIHLNNKSAECSEKSKIVFITGCNSPYFEPWLRLYESIKKNVINPTIYFFDLGLNEKEKNILNHIDVNYNFFNFDLTLI